MISLFSEESNLKTAQVQDPVKADAKMMGGLDLKGSANESLELRMHGGLHWL